MATDFSGMSGVGRNLFDEWLDISDATGLRMFTDSTFLFPSTGSLTNLCRVGPLNFGGGGYLLHSPSPYRLWFRFDLGSGVKDPIQGNGLDCQRLLHQAEEELAAAF